MFRKADGSAAISLKLPEFKLGNPFDNDTEEEKERKKEEKRKKAAMYAYVKQPPRPGSTGIFGREGLPKALDRWISSK